MCVKTGEAADLLIRTRQPVGGMPAVLYLLVFLGPFGFFGLLLLALFWPGEHLTVRLPGTEASSQRERHLQQLRLVALGLGVLSPVLGVLGVGTLPALWLALGFLFFAAAGALTVMLWRQSVGVSIDATRRWVTLTGVHPAFVEAASRREAFSRPSSKAPAGALGNGLRDRGG